jgi:hypothetical protein
MRDLIYCTPMRLLGDIYRIVQFMRRTGLSYGEVEYAQYAGMGQGASCTVRRKWGTGEAKRRTIFYS